MTSKSTHELEVWLFDERVGSLSLVHGQLSFAYATDWLAQPQATALSQSLPLQAKPFDDHQTRPFFAGLLPEGQMRRLIAQQFQVSGQNDFALLDHIGGECAGAVTFLEPVQALPTNGAGATGAPGDVDWLSDQKLLALLDELPRRPMLAGDEGLRLSLAGAQDKLPVVVDESIPGAVRIGLPRNGAPSSHILKPAIHAVEDSVANEGFCMLLAQVMGLRPANARIQSVLGRSFLLVKRYDRELNAQDLHQPQLQRLHQEDFCQALGVVPELKYQNEGGPGLAQCFALLRSVTRPSAPQVLRLLDGAIFNALIGNHDAHGKNFSLLYGGRAPVLAPFYDLLATAIYPQLTPKMAMKIGSKYKFSELEARHWEQFAEEAGLAKAATRKRLQQLANELPAAARKLQAAPPHGFAGNAVVKQIVQLIEQRCTLTLRRLA
ncbi:type II toxin-antitoxin system HipA family toxin [Comamonas sp. wu1-DMT]|uniref:type II toxin-antitoxin system HipA family toxin n=1 Tax=Comamonas sp. wu1-DMT TaxID=3126390 RepID=UPI0032E44219